MAKNAEFLICLLIMAMDLVAGILGIEAEIAQNKVKHLKAWALECRDPSHRAFKLGLAACVILAAAHAVGSFVGRCICIRSRNEYRGASANKRLAVASLIFSWIVVVVAFSMLMAGTLFNSKSRRSCRLAHHQLLLIGGMLCFIHGLFIVSFLVSAEATRKEDRIAYERREGTPGHGPA